MSADAKSRRQGARLYATLSALFFVLILIMANYLAFRHYQRWDWTSEGIYTLSERTEQVISELDEEVEIWLLLSEAEPEFRELRNLLSRYDAASRNIRLHFVDPDRNPGAYRPIAQRFGLGRAIIGEAIEGSDVAAVVALGDRHWKITRDDLVRRRFDSFDDDGTIELDVESERAITGALVEITSGEPTRVCLTRGHGEYDLGSGVRSLAAFRDEMRRENLEIETIETRGQSELDSGCHVIAVVGPERALTEDEVELLMSYLRGGGNLLLAFDPILASTAEVVQPTGFERPLRELGIRLDGGIVVELDQSLHPAGGGNPVGPFLVAEMPQHTITGGIRDEALAVSEMRSVRPVDEGGAVSPLLRTSATSFAAMDLGFLREASDLRAGPGDLPGPVTLGVATRVAVAGAPADDDEEEREPRGGRLVVLGGASLLSGPLMGNPGLVNRHFASATIGWLAERQALVAIPPRTVTQRPVTMSIEDVGNIGFRVVLLIPLAFVFLGFAVWWNRRQ